MTKVMQNDGEFEGGAIANEPAHTCTPASTRPMDCSHMRVQRRQFPSDNYAIPRFTPRYKFKTLIKSNKNAHPYAFENRRAVISVSAPTKKRPYPLPPPPTYKGGPSKIFTTFSSKGVS